MLDEAKLAALAPDVVVTQEACEVCAISYEQVVGSLGRTAPRARIVCLQPARLADALGDIRAVAEACGVAHRGEALVGDLERRLARLHEGGRRPRPRVAVLEWLAPPMLAGHWVPDTIAAAGGEPVGPRPGAASPYVSFDQVRSLRPDVLIVAPCGFNLERTLREAEPLGETLGALAPRILFLDGNAYLNRPCPRLVDAAETIAAFLRGEAVEDPLAAEPRDAPNR
jgi:iron complex transport system substrate-binding protein